MSPSHISKKESGLPFFVFIVAWLLLGGSVLCADSGKAKYHVFIDTDSAVDDLRAICLFLASPEFEVLGIATSDGVVDPRQGLSKVRSLLEDFGHEGIPRGAGREVEGVISPWRDFNRKVRWGEKDEIEKQDSKNAAECILSALEHEEAPVVFICLGGLTNLAQVLARKPHICEKLEKVVWYNDGIDLFSGTNYGFDEGSAQAVFSSSLTIEVLSNRGADHPEFNPEFLESIRALSSPYAKKIADVHLDGEVMARMESGHLEFWDDLVPVFLLHPQFFASGASQERNNCISYHIRDMEGIRAKYIEILTSRDKVRSEVFDGFPEDPHLFAGDVSSRMRDIIRKHGIEEWRIGVLTNELHGHLGVYAIVGAKMGLRARQYFHIGVDDISILSYAGSIPPLSCMNDGLQVSTGGTLGHGLITVSPGPPFRPEASFVFKGQSVSFKLKDRYWRMIKNDIRKGIEEYGVNSEGYWNYVRKLALHYWLDWDRMEIFDRNTSPL